MFNRMRLVAAAAALVATAPLAAVGTANAEQAAAKPERTISIKGIEPREGVFFVKGKVQPDYKQRFAIVERKLKSQKSWDNFRTFKTTNDSTYRERVYALKRSGIVCYRIKIKGNDTFKTSYSNKVCIRTFSA